MPPIPFFVYAALQNNYTPLHYASESGSAETVQVLLGAGADVNARAKVGRVYRSCCCCSCCC